MVITRSKKRKPWLTFLPTDLFHKIFLNLPVKSLLRFRSVTKTWQSVIEDPQFAKFYKNRLQSQTYVVHSKSSGETECAVTFRENFRVDAKYATLRVEVGDDITSEISERRWSSKRVWNVIGSVDGLIILKTQGFSNGEQWRDEFMCWNPSIRRFRVLPQPPTEMEDKISLYSGLGFDPSIKDYKYIRYIIRPSTTKTTSILVYTLGTNSWKTVEFKSRGHIHIPWHFCLSEHGQSVCCRGSLYWTIKFNGSRWLVSYDLNMEEFSAAEFPVVDDTGKWVIRCAHDGRSLSAAFISGNKVTMWLGEGEGGDVTWCQFCEFNSGLAKERDGGFYYPKDVISIDFEMGVVLLGYEDCVALYDLETQEKQKVFMKGGNSDFVCVDSYVETLALLN